MSYRLSIHLVPHPLWHRNCRYLMSKYEWQKFRKSLLAERSLICSICSYVAPLPRNIFVHEDWHYEFGGSGAVAHLKGFNLVCWDCHSTEHWGSTERQVANGKFPPDTETRLIKHWARVNGASEADFKYHKQQAFDEYGSLSDYREWLIDWGPMQEWVDREYGGADPFEGQPLFY